MTTVHPAPTPPIRDQLASLPRQDRHKPKCGPVRKSKMGRRRAWVLLGVHVVIGVHIVWWLTTGTAITPVEPSEAMQTIEVGRINAGFLLFAALIASTLVFGRWFCGWACHVVALQDASAWLLGKLSLRPRPVRSRLLVLAPWVVAGQMFAWPVIEAWLSDWPFAVESLGVSPRALPSPSDWELHLTTNDLWETFPGPLMGTLTFVVVGFLIVWWLGAKGFCTYGCPYGAFFAVADRFAPVRIKVTDACDACGHCTSVCTSNVRVHEEVAKHGKIVDPGCMKCLDCVSVCPKEALYVGVAVPSLFTTSQQRIQARADFTWPEEILMAAIALIATQWTFRGAWFGEGVPFLMSVGLGVITAVFAMVFWRLLRRPDMTFQHTVWKQGRSFTRAGRWVLAGAGVWLAFTAHTFVAQRWKASAMIASQAPLRAYLWEGVQDRPVLQQSLDRVEGALAWDLVDDPHLCEMRGLLLRSLDRHAEAEAALLAAKGDHDALFHPAANLALATYFMDPARRRYDDAERLLLHVLQVDPGNKVAEMLLEQLAGRR